jgi:DNA-binding CsgD family transcriptional regulator
VTAVHGHLSRWRREPELIGRRAECAALDQLIGAVLAGESQALVVHGEPGVGKTALLEYLAVNAPNTRVLRAGGVQSEMELPYAGLHQLCLALLGRLDHLPQPQGDALRVAFGVSAGPAPNRFLVGLAVLSLLSDAAEQQPVLCLVDDQQWLDRASAQVLAFVARRLGAESVGLVLATRVVSGDLEGLPHLAVAGLRAADAGTLLDTVLTGPVDARVREQIVAETRGNPLALLELPRGLTPAQLAGGFGLPGAVPLSGSIEESFVRRADALPDSARLFLLVAASEPSGDPVLARQAAVLLGIEPDLAAAPAIEADLLDLGIRVRFRHPLARSAVYQSASAEDRHRVHRALAGVTDPGLDPDRRAWHLAHAAAGPDEDVAAELERSAGRARARGGVAAVAAFLLRAAMLTIDPARRADRALAAVEAQIQAGSFDGALDLLSMAEAGPLSDVQRAHVALLRAQLAFVLNRGSDAPPLLLMAARQLESVDSSLARATYLDALSAAVFTGRLAGPSGDVLEIARAADAAPPPPGKPRAWDLLLDGTAAMYNRGYVAGLPMLRQGLIEFGAGMSVEEELHWLWLASITAMQLCDDDRWDVLSARHVELTRTTGALSELPLALTLRALFLLFCGDLTTAGALADEAQAVKDATGTNLAPYGAVCLLAFRGEEAVASDAINVMLDDVTRRGEGVGVTMAEWANSVLYNGLGRYDDATAAALRSIGYESDRGSLVLPCVELVEAAVRSEQTGIAADAYDRLAEVTSASGTDWALGLLARSKALLSAGAEAEGRYQESIARLGRTRLRVDLARVHLLYGEWLRRARRQVEAREQLRTAQSMLDAMGVAAFAERARRELRATGITVRKRVDAHRHGELTAQEAQVARMARDGLSNPEIAGRLFISAHTVQYHLRKVFTKLGVSSRGQLEMVLPNGT